MDKIIKIMREKNLEGIKKGETSIIGGTEITWTQLYGENIPQITNLFWIHSNKEMLTAEFDVGQVERLVIKASSTPDIVIEAVCDFIAMRTKFETSKHFSIVGLFADLRTAGLLPEIINDSEIHIYEIDPPPLPYQQLPYGSMLMSINSKPNQRYIFMKYVDSKGWLISFIESQQSSIIAEYPTLDEAVEEVIKRFSYKTRKDE